MIILACETSTLLGSVAVLENEKILSFEESLRQGSHSDSLNILIEKALQKADKKLIEVDLFVAGIGPGSFTGIRISLNAVKTLAYCLNKPVVGISSLHSLAAQTFVSKNPIEFENIQIISMINAYKNMIYVSTYECKNNSLVELKKPTVIRVQHLVDYITQKAVVCGDGYVSYKKYFETHLPENIKKNIIRLDDISDEPHAKISGQLAFKKSHLKQSWNQLLPLYLRASEAEENLQGIKYQSLE